MMRPRFRIEQFVCVQNEITHFGMIHGALGRRFPRIIGRFVIWKRADKINLCQVFKLDPAHVFKFATNHDVKQLIWLWGVSLM